MTPFSQEIWACRCEWGLAGASALAPAEVTIVVDVLSFTTCVDVAVSHGAAILPYAWGDDTAAEFARLHGAELAGKRRKTRYSLAPESYVDAPADLRCVLPSPNGAQISIAREFASEKRDETQTVGIGGGFVSGVVGTAGPAGPRGYFAVKWNGPALVFESGAGWFRRDRSP